MSSSSGRNPATVFNSHVHGSLKYRMSTKYECTDFNIPNKKYLGLLKLADAEY